MTTPQQHVSVEGRRSNPLDVVILNDGTGGDLAVKWAAINATTSGDTTVVSAVSGKKLQTVQQGFSVSAAVDIAWKSGGSTTKIAARSFPANGGHETGNVSPGKIMETAVGEAIVINLSTNANVRGQLNYIEV